MKIAISSSGNNLEAPVDPRFGRAKNFIIYDTDTKDFSVIENTQNLNAAQGAGIQAGQNVVAANVKAVLTGNCGPKAFVVLNQAEVEVYVGVSGTVQETINAYMAGELKPAESANVQGHWM